MKLHLVGIRSAAVSLSCAALAAFADDPGVEAMNATDIGVYVESVSGVQRWPWNGLVDIDFRIQCPGYPGAYAFIDISAFYESPEGVTNTLDLSTLTLGGNSLSFPWATTAGTYRVTWNAAADAPTANLTNVRYRVKANMARYMVLSATSDRTKINISYLDEPDYKDGETVWKDEYKTTKMALRLIHPHSNVVGAASTGEYGYGTENATNGEWKVQRTVTVTRPYYIGIYEVTREQTYSLGLETSRPYDEGDARPRKHSYDQLRGSFADGINWPKTGSAVSESSIIGILRAKSGNDKFDLPTDAEWELAARAGYDTPVNTGETYPTDVSANRQKLYPVAQCTGGNVTVPKSGGSSQLQEVGLKTPNRWGLYDCHGNVYEFVLDVAAYDSSSAAEIDPVGAASDTEAYHFRRGGSYTSRYHTLLIGAHRDPHTIAPGSYTDEDGFRLCWRFPTPAAE